jgi:hypothetical protein
MPGYGWIFPLGDGTVNVGAGLLDTFTGFKSINTTKLMDAFVATAPARWGISPATAWPPVGEGSDRRLGSRRRGRPGSSPVTQPVRSTRSTARISYCLRDGADGRRRGAPGARGDGLALQRYLTQARGDLRRLLQVRRTFVKVIGNPAIMREVTRIGMHSRPLMEWVLRIMANLLRPDEIGPAEAAYKGGEQLVGDARPVAPRVGTGSLRSDAPRVNRVRETWGQRCPRG